MLCECHCIKPIFLKLRRTKCARVQSQGIHHDCGHLLGMAQSKASTMAVAVMPSRWGHEQAYLWFLNATPAE